MDEHREEREELEAIQREDEDDAREYAWADQLSFERAADIAWAER